MQIFIFYGTTDGCAWAMDISHVQIIRKKCMKVYMRFSSTSIMLR